MHDFKSPSKFLQLRTKKDIDRSKTYEINYVSEVKFPHVNYFREVLYVARPIFFFEQAKVGVNI